MKLHEVLFAPCLSARPLFSCHRSIAHASVAGPLLVCHWSVTGLSLVCHWSVTGLLLVCHWSVTGLLLVCSGHGRWSGSLIVHPSCIARASLVCLFLFLLVCCSSVVGHGRCSACCSPVAPPACLSVGPSLSCHSSVCWPVAARPSLMYRWSACLSITGCRCPVPVQGHRSIAHPSARASARVRFACRWSVTPLSHESLTGLSVRSSLVCLLVHLLGSWSLPRGWSATRLSPIRRWSWPLVHMIVHRCSSTCCSPIAPSAVLSPVCLLEPWSLACSSVGGLLFVRHWPWSSICYSCTACLSPRLSCRSFACCSAIGRLYCRSAVALSACLSARPSLVWLSHGLGCRWFVAGPSVRVVHCSSV